jgi:hypothetical protein
MKVLINRDKTFVGAVNKNSLHQSTKLDRGFNYNCLFTSSSNAGGKTELIY